LTENIGKMIFNMSIIQHLVLQIHIYIYV